MAGTIVLKVIGNAASGMAALRNIQGGIDDVVRASKVLGAAFSAMAAAGTGLIKNFTMSAARTEMLGTAMRIVGDLAGYSEGQLDKLEKEVHELGITTQTTRQGLTRMITAQLDLSKATELAATAQNLARIAGMNSSEVWDRLIRAITTMNPRLLRQVNIYANLNDVFGEHASKMSATQKQAALLNYILKQGERIAGVYAAAADDVGGALLSLPRLFQDTKEAIGKHFLPALKVAVDLLSNFLKFFEALPEPAQKVIAMVLGIGTAFAALMGPLLLLVGFLPTILSGFSALVSVLPVLLPVIAGLAAVVGLLVAAGALLAKAWKENWGGIQITVAQVVRRIKKLIEPLVEDVRFWLAEIKKAWAAFVAVVRPLVENLINFVREKLLFGSGLPEFLTFLRDVVNVALKMVTQFLETLRRLVAGEDDAWDPLYDALLNVMTLIALAWKRYVSKALTWGWNLVVELATGMAKAARAVLTEVVTQIGNLIQSFLGAFSPPKKGPLARITDWGRNLINEYIRGFALADFGAIRDALSPIQQALEAAVRVGDIEEPDMLRIFREVRGLAAELFAEFRKSGEISAEMLERIGDALGEGAQDYVDYIRLTLEHQAALGNLRQLEDEVVAARAEGYVPKALQDQLDAAREEVEAKKEAVDWQREMLAFQQESVDIQARLIEAMEKLAETMTKVVSGEAGAGGVGEMSSLLDEIAKRPPIDLAGKLGLGVLSEEFLGMKEKVRKFFEELPGKVEGWLSGIADTVKANPIFQAIVAFVDEHLDPAFEKVRLWLEENLPVAIDALAVFWTDHLKPALETVRLFITDSLIPAFETIVLWLAENIPVALKALADLWENTLKPAIEIVWQFVQDHLFPLFEALRELLDVSLNLALTALAGLWENVLKPALETVWKYLDENINPKLEDLERIFDSIGTAVDTVIGWIKDFTDTLKKIKLPDWLTPGSPTPFEVGLRGIADALREVDTLDLFNLPNLQGQISAALNLGALNGVGRIVSPTVVFAEGAFAGAFPGVKDGRDAGSVMSEVQRMVEEGYLRAQVPGGVSG